MKLVFATQNQHKAAEIQKMLPSAVTVQSLRDLNCYDDIPETGDTLEANALIKARFVHKKWGLNCFADDTGLEIDFLHGKPGVHSARYAGESKDNEQNMNLVMDQLKNTTNRKACFRTVIALILDNREILFEGIVNGTITQNKSGNGGFGYDPIFIPDGYDKTFAEMTPEEKNEISHRGRAISKLISHIKGLEQFHP